MLIIKSNDPSVKNFGFVSYDEKGLKKIVFPKQSDLEQFLKQNPRANVKNLKVGEIFSFRVPFGSPKDKPIKFHIVGTKEKFIMKCDEQ